MLFADLVGSTELGASLDPEYARDLLERFYDAMEAEIALGGGTTEKFIGDAVVAAFGAPAAQEDHAERALQVALWMRERLAQIFGDRLAMRIGVNTGEVVVGRPREGSSFATGDAVNVAARLEQAARPGQILVGERTAALVGGAFEFGEPATVDAKGKAGGVVSRELVRMVASRRPRGGRGLQTIFVGRRRELGWLERELSQAQADGRPRLATIVGEPGLGKTSLVREFRERLPEGTLFRLGRCLSYGRSVTYSPLADVLRQEFALREEDSRETILARLGGREILGLALGLDVTGELDPRAAVLRLQDEWVRLGSELAAQMPLVLTIEDVHWAAEPLIELLERTLAEAKGSVLVLATARPEYPDLPPGESLHLHPLDDAEVVELIDGAIGAPLDEPARGLVVAHAEGNPFFVEEVLAELLDRELLERRNGAFVLREGTGPLAVPDSVQAVLAARIDLLGAEAKEALQAAAVIGRSFSPAGLAALVGSAAEARTLVERGFVRPTEPELVFKHALTREVAYGGLPRASRARLHAAYADWLADEDPRDTRVGSLAYHYAEAVNPDVRELAWRGRDDDAERLRTAALHWLSRSIELALGRFDLDDALASLRRAVDLAPDDVELWHELGRVNALKMDGEAFWQAMLKAVELTSDPAKLAELHGDLAWESTMRGAMWKRAPDDALVLGWIDKALELAPPDSRPLARALTAKASREDDAVVVAEAIEIAERLGDVELLSYGYWTQFGIEQLAARFHEAYEWDLRRRVLAGRFTDPDHLALMYWGSSIAELALGHVAEADAYAARHDAVAARMSPHHAVHALSNLVTIDEAAGRWERLHSRQERAERGSAANVDSPCIENARTLLACAVACAELGLDAEARRLEAAAAALGFEGYALWLDSSRARLALIRGDLDQVESMLEGSEKWRWPVFSYLNGVAVRLDALVAVGRMDEAEEDALRHAQPDTYLEPFALRTLGIVRGDPVLVDQAVERFEVMGLDWHVAKTRVQADL